MFANFGQPWPTSGQHRPPLAELDAIGPLWANLAHFSQVWRLLAQMGQLGPTLGRLSVPGVTFRHLLGNCSASARRRQRPTSAQPSDNSQLSLPFFRGAAITKRAARTPAGGPLGISLGNSPRTRGSSSQFNEHRCHRCGVVYRGSRSQGCRLGSRLPQSFRTPLLVLRWPQNADVMAKLLATCSFGFVLLGPGTQGRLDRPPSAQILPPPALVRLEEAYLCPSRGRV